MSEVSKNLPTEKRKMRPVAEMTTRENMQVHHHFCEMRNALVKAQLDWAQILMLAEGATQTALEAEVMAFLHEMQAHFSSLKKLLVQV